MATDSPYWNPKPETLIDTVSYFFLLPNFSFMHFPVVDYRTFQRGYFAADVHAIQRRGLEMMLRGTFHLLCYLVIYHELLLAAAELVDTWARALEKPPLAPASDTVACASAAWAWAWADWSSASACFRRAA